MNGFAAGVGLINRAYSVAELFGEVLKWSGGSGPGPRPSVTTGKPKKDGGPAKSYARTDDDDTDDIDF